MDAGIGYNATPLRLPQHNRGGKAYPAPIVDEGK